MWQNIKYYAIAYGIVVLGVLVSTGLELLQGILPELHPLLMRERLAKHGLLSSDRLGSRFRGNDG